MHASFRRKQTVGIFTLDPHGGGFYPGALAGLRIDYRSAKALALTPAQVHAQQHFGPILGFGAAGAWLDGENGVEAIAFAGEQRFGFELRDVLVGGVKLLVGIAQDGIALCDVALFVREMQISVDVAGDAREFLFGGDAALRTFTLLKDLLRLFLILPEVLLGAGCFEFRQKFPMAGNVKDNSARARCARRVPESDVRDLR